MIYSLLDLTSKKFRCQNLKVYKNKYIIYSIKNIINNKIYIGLTKNFSLRIANHIFTVSKPKHYIHKSIRKHGFENFIVKIEKFCDSLEDLIESEIFFIKKYKSSSYEFGYNLTEGGNIMKPNKETIEKMKTSQKRIKIATYDLYGNLIKIFDSIRDCAREIQAGDANISVAALNKGKLNNYMFIREDMLKKANFPIKINKYVPKVGQHRKNIKSKISIKCKVVVKETNKEYFADSLSDMSKLINISYYEMKKLKKTKNLENSYLKLYLI